MILRRGFRYRIYPTPQQADRLSRWEGALRALWNIANEQRLVYLRRGTKMPSAFDQILQLPSLRIEAPWIGDVPSNVCGQVIIDLDLAWKRYFSGISRSPNWKKKGRNVVHITEPHQGMFRIATSGIVFPKLGFIRAVLHRPVVGIPKRCTIVRDVDQWLVSVQCEQDIPEPEARISPVVAIDRGIVNILADSDGVLVPNPKYFEETHTSLAHAQRIVSRRQKGSKRQGRAKLRVAKLHQRIRRQRAHFLHVLSANYAKSHGVVVVEKLNVRGLMRGGLGRYIGGAGWAKFCSMLRYKLEASGGRLIEVSAHYSSQTCVACGAVEALSRVRERFVCVACGHEDDADLNAAKVLLRRGDLGDTGRGGYGEVSRPVKRQLRVVRHGRSTSVRLVE